MEATVECITPYGRVKVPQSDATPFVHPPLRVYPWQDEESGPDFRAWVGGSTPPDTLPGDGEALATYFYACQLQVWGNAWGDAPDADTDETFRRRARFDAWATVRGVGE